MMVSFGLEIVASMLGEDEQKRQLPEETVIPVNLRLVQATERFRTIVKAWAPAAIEQDLVVKAVSELHDLFEATSEVMTEMNILFADIDMWTRVGVDIKVPSMILINILKLARTGLVKAQRTTHDADLFKYNVHLSVPPKFRQAEHHKAERKSLHKQNKDAHTIAERRKRPVQCCLFAIMVIARFLTNDLEELLADYEEEIMRSDFDKVISIDDKITFERNQLEYHSKARLIAPKDRRSVAEVSYQETRAPHLVRNESEIGPPVVTNIHGCGPGPHRLFQNPNRINRPQHVTPFDKRVGKYTTVTETKPDIESQAQQADE